jgi:two-component system chemotaxis response regulator CheY
MEALQLLDRNPQIKLVLLDRYMPQMDGLEFMMRLKQNPKFQYVSVSMITSENDIDEKMKTLSDYKADYYITKPVTKPALVRMFSRLFGE